MALDKVIDSAELDANLTAVADAIRTKGGTTGELEFPSGFVSAVEGIQAGGGEEYDRLYDSFVKKDLTEYRNDRLTELYESEFRGWRVEIDLIFPNVTKIHGNVFMYCGNIKSVDFGQYLSFGGYGFYNCGKLKTLILRSSKLCPLISTGTFYGSPFDNANTGGTVYVPSALISEYQQATNWSTLYQKGSCNFVAIEGSEYE